MMKFRRTPSEGLGLLRRIVRADLSFSYTFLTLSLDYIKSFKIM
jgi:hypothetical protein